MTLNFGKGVTLITILSMWAVVPLSIVIGEWPNKWFMLSWTIFWVVFEVCNIQVKKHKQKKTTEKQTNLMTEVARLIKDSNVNNDDIVKILKQVNNILN